mgnify:CR=1 FL=1
MRTIKNKLKSNKGASVLIALGLFMICAMISSVVVVAAASGSSRNVQRIERQRAYLAVSSAAQVIMDELQDVKKYVGREEDRDFTCNSYEEDTIEYQKADNSYIEKNGYRIPNENFSLESVEGAMDALIVDDICVDQSDVRDTYIKQDPTDPTKALATDLQGALGAMVQEGIEEIYKENATSYTKEFSVSLKNTDERLAKVNCKYIMDEEYNIEIQVTIPDSDYAVTITLEAKTLAEEKTVAAAGEEDSLVCNHLIYYKKPSGINNYVLDETHMDIVGVRTIRSLTITWEKPQLVKGVTIS